MGQVDPVYAVTALIVIFFGIGLHEYAHCKVADSAGDPTPSFYGRVTLNLFKHFDPMGTVMIVVTTLTGFGIGWGKPAPMDPSKMRNPRWDFFMAVAAGPMCNFLQAVIYAIILRLLLASHSSLLEVKFIYLLLLNGVLINISLMYFNLIPLGPLDGHWLVGLLMPEKPRHYWYIWNRTTGLFVLFGIILLGNLTSYNVLSKVLVPPVMATLRLLLGW